MPQIGARIPGILKKNKQVQKIFWEVVFPPRISIFL